jgi:hypothetical protein
VAECGKWIDFSGAARGNEASKYAGEDDDEDSAGERPGIRRVNMPELIAAKPRGSPGADDSQADAAGDQRSKNPAAKIRRVCIDANKIDTVVIYKVDRLTQSLADSPNSFRFDARKGIGSEVGLRTS